MYTLTIIDIAQEGGEEGLTVVCQCTCSCLNNWIMFVFLDSLAVTNVVTGPVQTQCRADQLKRLGICCRCVR